MQLSIAMKYEGFNILFTMSQIRSNNFPLPNSQDKELPPILLQVNGISVEFF